MRLIPLHATGVMLVVAAAACTRPPTHAAGAPAAPSPAAEIVVDAGAEREPLAGYPEIMELRDGAARLGVVSVPLGARAPRPIMIALHGGSDRPELACRGWRIATDAYPFVVCPHGWGGDEARLAWDSVADTQERIARAIAAVRNAFGDRVADTSTIVLAGFSMGACEVAKLAEAEPAVYRRIVIADAAHDPAPALRFARVWAAGGGERVMFMCTTSGCEPSMRAAAKKAAAARPARLVVAPTQVHAFSARAASSLRRDWAWLVDGADGWDRYAPPSDLSPEGRIEAYEPDR
jgi:pimeloyl-ACP methyl ester carboxylesterase